MSAAAGEGDLSDLRYYRDKFDLGKGRAFAGGWTHFAVRAADGTRLEGTRLDPALPAGLPERAIVLAHGLFGHRRLPPQMALAESLTRFGTVWTLDLRGHGTSGGSCTFGEAEALDVAAVRGLARAGSPGSPLVTIGLSMGAAAAIRSAALAPSPRATEPVPSPRSPRATEPTPSPRSPRTTKPALSTGITEPYPGTDVTEPAPSPRAAGTGEPGSPDAVVAISSPATWRARRGPAALRTALVWSVPGAPALVRRLTGVRLGTRLPASPEPVQLIGAIAPAPVLVVHGTDDPFFPTPEA
ncbi:MAG: alpha/beta fold hydrolase, partial [Actinomycetota bacterium]